MNRKSLCLSLKPQGYDLIAPYSLYWEIGSAFSAMIKRGRITLEQATAAIEIYTQIPIDLVDVDLEPALKIVEKHKVYAYDAYMIACASSRGCPLLTLDSGLAHAAKAARLEVWEAN